MKTKLTKGLALLLMLTMLLGMFAGCAKSDSNATTAVNASNPSNNGENNGNNNNNNTSTYTLHSYMGASPKTWNPHTWETGTDYTITGYTTKGLYAMDFNATMDGYTYVSEMADGEPIDVTAQYAGDAKWGIPADATEGYAYTVKLNPNATWENGEAITADDWIYSFERLLSSDMKNYRANLYWSGNLSIYNAQNYYRQDKAGEVTTEFVWWYEVYKEQLDAINASSNWDGEGGFWELVDELYAEGKLYLELGDIYGIAGVTDTGCIYDYEGERLVAANDETLFRNEYYADDQTDKAEYMISGKYLWDNYAYGDQTWIVWDWYYYNAETGLYKNVYVKQETSVPEITFDDVGIIKTGEYELTFIMDRPISVFDFKVANSDAPLVYKPLYEKCITANGSTYGTSLDTWMSYGPYKLTAYQTDKQITLTRNENWYGYSDGKHVDQYQTTDIDLQIITSQATALQLFLQGKLDSVSLTTNDMSKYATSEYLLSTPGDFTYKITPNTNRESLLSRQSSGENKVILSYAKFRQAMSLCLDRSYYCNGVYAGMSPAYGLWSSLYLVSAEDGIAYRSTEQAKQVLRDLYGIEDVNDITGYDKNLATQLFVEAYEEALAAGDIKADDQIVLQYIAWYDTGTSLLEFNFFQDSINAAVAGTVLEGRITLELEVDSYNYYDRTYEGDFDLLVTAWGGDTMNVFRQAEYYSQSYSNCSEYMWGSDVTEITVQINGADVTKTYDAWVDALLNGEYATADLQIRIDIFAALEKCLLTNYIVIPLDVTASYSLYSHRMIYAVDTYIPQLGYGGIQHLKYVVDDATWEAYCAGEGYQLIY